MSSLPIERYLKGLTPAQKRTLQDLRRALRKLLPRAKETMMYGMPGFRAGKHGIVAYAAFKEHCSYFPMSGGVLSRLDPRRDIKAPLSASKGTLRFPLGRRLPPALLKKLIRIRMDEITEKNRQRGIAIAFYANGAVRFEGKWRHGAMHGAWKFYRQDGSLMRSGSFKQGKQTGLWRTWERSGRAVVKVTRY